MAWGFYNSAGVARVTGASTFVNTLPTTPFDGQEIYYQSTTAGTGGGATATMADVGAVFHLRWRAAASGSYKWEFVGGAPITDAQSNYTGYCVGATYTRTVSASTNTALPRLTVPLAGDYRVEIKTQGLTVSAAGDGYLSFSQVASAGSAASGDGMFVRTTGAANLVMSGASITQKTLTAAALYLEAKATVGNVYPAGADGNVQVILSITPIRVG